VLAVKGLPFSEKNAVKHAHFLVCQYYMQLTVCHNPQRKKDAEEAGHFLSGQQCRQS